VAQLSSRLNTLLWQSHPICLVAAHILRPVFEAEFPKDGSRCIAVPQGLDLRNGIRLQSTHTSQRIHFLWASRTRCWISVD